MGRKAIFFDVDGTLIPLGPVQVVPESARDAIHRSRAKGNLIFVNTGRGYGLITPGIKELEKDGIVCGCGTCLVFDGRPERLVTLPGELCRRVAEKAEMCGIYAAFEGFDGVYFDPFGVETRTHKLFKSWMKLLGKPCNRTIYTSGFSFDKIYAWKSPDCDMQAFIEYAQDYFEVITREDGDIEFVPKGFSKATGMAAVLEKYNIPVEDSYAFGDSNNDLSMLQYTPNSIVMRGNNPELCAIASFVTKSAEDGGVAYAMECLGLV